MPGEIYFYIILDRNPDTREWEWKNKQHFDTLEDAQSAINILINCRFDDYFRYEISGDSHSRNVWDTKEKDWVMESRIEMYRATKARV